MVNMPYHGRLDGVLALPQAAPEVVSTDWREKLPVLNGKHVTLRELRPSDAASLFTMLTTEEVSRFISPPPPSVEAFERFIAQTSRQRAAGTHFYFAVTLQDGDDAVGLFQVRAAEAGFGTAEWGFALGSAFWGTGVFCEGAELVLKFAFETVNVHRLEARVAVQNGRGHGALQKLGAVQEGVLRKSFLKNGVYADQVLHTIVKEDWHALRACSPQNCSTRIH